MNQVEGILATTTFGLVGHNDIIPWHHVGDLKRFKDITTGHTLLMGAKTYLGIAKHYFKTGKPVLPGRDIFVYGSPRAGKSVTMSILAALDDMSRLPDHRHSLIGLSSTDSPAKNIELAQSYMKPGQKLFIAGGAEVYTKFLAHCSKIHLTLLEGFHGTANVRLSFPTTELLCLSGQSLVAWAHAAEARNWNVLHCGSDAEEALAAHYFSLVRKL